MRLRQKRLLNPQKREERGRRGQRRTQKTTIFYITDEVQSSQYINIFREAKKDAVILKHNIERFYFPSGAEGSDYPV